MNKSGKKSGNLEPDRRVQKTRKLLSDAFAALIVEKGYDEVSIQDILDRANVGRSTFYAHYENKEQLLLFGHEHLRNLVWKEGATQIDFLSFYRHLVDMNALAVKLLSSAKSAEVVTTSLRNILDYSISQLYQFLGAETALPMNRMRTEAAAAALVQLMTSWLQNKMPCSPEEMAAESAALLERIVLSVAPGSAAQLAPPR